MKNIILIALLFQANVFFAQGEHRGGGMNRENMPKDGVIKGIVIDKQTKKAVKFANVVLFTVRDSSVAAGTVADENGNFELANLKYGRYYLIVDFIGYYKKTISDLKVNPRSKINNLGTIYLNQSAEGIEEVEITGERNFVEYKIDRKVINISKNVNATGGTIVDALENAPSIQVDIDGNVSMRGSTNFVVLIDGKPSILDANDILQQIPASSVKNIEIITNPSVKFDPDGTTGIINVIMKKNTLNGLSGIINASIGTGDKYSTDFLLNYKIKKVNYYIGANYGDRTYASTGSSLRETYLNDTTSFLNSISERNYQRKYYSIKGGVDIDINDKNTISFSGGYRDFSFGMESFSQNKDYTIPTSNVIYSLNNGTFEMDGNSYSGSLDFKHLFAKKGHELLASVQYSGRTGGVESGVTEKITGENYLDLFSSSQYRTFQDRGRESLRLKLDYSYPINEKMKFEAGFQSRLRTEGGDFTQEDSISGNWLIDETLSNELVFNRNIHSIYSTLSGEIVGIQYMLGVRGEYTDRLIEQVTSNDSYPLQRFDFFPSVHLTKEISKTQQIQTSYSRRVNRPRHWYMNPFPGYSDAYSVRVGNPDLLPEYTDSYELSYNKRIKKSFFNLEAYYRQTNNEINRVQELMDDGRILSTFDNLDKEISYGSELSGNIQIQKWWMMYANINVYRFNLEGETAGLTTNVESTNYDFRGNTSFIFSKSSRLQIDGMYRAPSVTAQGEREAFYFFGAAYKQDFFKRKLSLVFKVRDIFQTGNYISNSKGDGFSSHDERIRESPIFTLSLSYKINNYKKKRGSREGMEDEGEGEM